jgi:hypothetical protein
VQLGLFQLLFLEGVPARAAVSEAVELAKGSNGATLVNAVLRRAADEGPSGLLDPIEDEGVRESYPHWLVELWRGAYGKKTATKLMRRLNEPAETVLRANRLKTSPEALAAALEGKPVGSDGVLLDRPFDAYGHPCGPRATSCPVALLPGGRPSRRAAAGRARPRPVRRAGGKTTHLAALMRDRGEIRVGREVRRPRRRACAGRASAWGDDRAHRGARRRRAAGEPRASTGSSSTRPCSGLGTLQQRPDLRWRMTPAAGSPGILDEQRAILAAAGRGRPSGRSAGLVDLHAEPGRERAAARRARGVRAAGGHDPLPARDALSRLPGDPLSIDGMTEQVSLGMECPNCAEPWLRPTTLPGRYRCVFCLHRYELRSVCPDCGEHSTIVRMSDTSITACVHCGGSMLCEV